MTDDGMPGVGEALDEALMETHHLANLSGLDEARLARRRLVEAQSATSVERTRDRLEQATEYLELARLQRRDTAAGFVQAREMVSYAQAGLRHEQPVPLRGSPLELVRSEPEPEPRTTLQELRAEAAVNSYEQLQYNVELEDTFRELQRQVEAGEIDHEPADDGELDPDAALELASLEIDIERSLQRSGDDSEFDFLANDDLERPDDADAIDDEAGVSNDGGDAPGDTVVVRGDGTAEVQDVVGDETVEVQDEAVAEALDEAADMLDDATDDTRNVDGDVPDVIEIPDFDVETPTAGGKPQGDEGTPGDDSEADDVVETSGAEPTGADDTEDRVARPGER